MFDNHVSITWNLSPWTFIKDIQVLYVSYSVMFCCILSPREFSCTCAILLWCLVHFHYGQVTIRTSLFMSGGLFNREFGTLWWNKKIYIYYYSAWGIFFLLLCPLNVPILLAWSSNQICDGGIYFYNSV